MIKTSLATLAANSELRKLLRTEINETWLKPWVEVIADTLSREDLRDVFSQEGFETFAINLVQASLTAAAENPALLDDAIREDWLKALIEELADTLSSTAKRDIFTKEGLSKIGVDLAKALADNPRLVAKLDVSKEILALQVVREVLKGMDPASGWKADKIAKDILAAVLHAIADRPEDLGANYSTMVGSLASTISKLVAKDWPVERAGELAESLLIETLLNPKVLLEIYPGVPAWVLAGVKAGIDSATLASAGISPLLGMIDEIAASGLHALGKRGKKKLEALMTKHGGGLATAEAELVADIQGILGTALPQLASKLGDGLSLANFPDILRDLVLTWAGDPLDDADVLAATNKLIDSVIS